ncbi:MAG: nitronate monooxygenase [Streptosporangiaceae bacterium]|jgi:nitronate monooxygenase
MLSNLGVSVPVLAAPMAGGPSTPELVIATAKAGGLGFLAGGYKTPAALGEQIAAVREHGVPFGVNLFAPNPVPVDPAAFREYAKALQPEAEAYGLDLTTAAPREDDDVWDEKISMLLADPVPLVSFTFGLPSAQVLTGLRRVGTVVAQTVTTAREALLATERGVDLLIVQSTEAGAHSGTLTPHQPPPSVPLKDLIAQVRGVTSVPIVATGGLATPEAIANVIKAGAVAAAVGTVLLRSDEAGTSPIHREALANPPGDGSTVITRAFTGRPARGLRNRFTDQFDGVAPLGYPALHHLTSPLRSAAAKAGDAELVHLWAGTGYRHATDEPAGDILRHLTTGL